MLDNPRLRGIIVITAVLVVIFLVLGAVGGLFSLTDDGDGRRYGEMVRVEWTAMSMDPPDGLYVNEAFTVSDGTTSLKLRYDVDLPSRDVGEWGSIRFEPSVEIALRLSSGTTVWEVLVESTDSDLVVHPGPYPGTWYLTMTVKAYGGELMGLEFHDSVAVTVSTHGP